MGFSLAICLRIYRKLVFLFFFCSFFFFNFTILYCFCHILTWIHHRYTRVPYPEPSPSSLPVPSLWKQSSYPLAQAWTTAGLSDKLKASIPMNPHISRPNTSPWVIVFTLLLKKKKLLRKLSFADKGEYTKSFTYQKVFNYLLIYLVGKFSKMDFMFLIKR